MKNKIFLAIVALCSVTLFAGTGAAEQAEADMFASVIVNPTFKFTLDNSYISFGYAKPGDSVELNPDTFFNYVKCNSNKGKTWSLKIAVTTDSVALTKVPVGSFKWKVFRATGDGVAADGWQPFSAEPAIAYTSGPQDTTGQDVTIQFQYKLELPNDATGGYYNLKVVYSMTDNP